MLGITTCGRSLTRHVAMCSFLYTTFQHDRISSYTFAISWTGKYLLETRTLIPLIPHREEGADFPVVASVKFREGALSHDGVDEEEICTLQVRDQKN